MRSALLILASVLLIGGGFFVYTMFQPMSRKPPARALGPVSRQARPAATRSLRGLQDGESVWVKRYDPKTGELSSQFKGERYEPQKDRTVHVEKPQAEFFSNDGRQRIRVEGVTGDVVMELPPEEKPGRVQSRVDTQAPSSGKLYDVVISVFEPADAEEPNLVAKMNNASFDNELFRIATEAYSDDQGQRVEADEVPVVVRGKDYDFDGRGLVIRWNELDRKLQLLEIAHGESLTVKNASSLNKPGLTARPAAPAPATTQPAANAAAAAMLASADPRAFVLPVAESSKSRASAAAAKKKAAAASGSRRRSGHATPAPHAATRPTTRPRIERDQSPVVYRASFERDVRVFEADKPIIVGEHMDIDLLQENSALATTTQPTMTQAPAAATQPSAGAGAGATSKPATARRKRRDANEDASASSSSSSSASQPASTQPAQGPITVKWTGKLRVVPLSTPPPQYLVPGKAAINIVGSPVVLTREGTEARAGSAFYNAADQSASLRASAGVPVVTMTDARGAKVTTPQLDYTAPEDPAEPRLAHLVGASRAEIPIEGEGGKRQNVIAAWSDDCQLRLASVGADKAAIERADLRGDVKIDHPQLNMTSRELSLRFDPTVKPKSASSRPAAAVAADEVADGRVAPVISPATTSPTTSPATSPAENPASTLREIVARGAVKCRVIDEQQKLQSIDADTLEVLTATDARGQTYARQLQADGNVRTSENGRTMDEGHLFAELAPTTRPAKAATQETGAKTQASAATEPAASEPAATGAAATGAAATEPAASTQPATQASTGPSNPFGAGANVRLVTLRATDNVRLATADGGSAAADSITVDARDPNREIYNLIGKPDATVSDGKTTIVGPTISMMPDDKLAVIEGAGTLHGKQADDPKQTIDIAWARRAVVNGATNLIDVDDHVRVRATQADGTINAATADKLQAKLAPKPTTQTTTQATTQTTTQATKQATTTAPTTAVASTRRSQTDKMNFLAGKEITTTTLSGNVEVKSELLAADGSLARGLNLFGDTVVYNRATGRMEVPVAGKMLYQDHRAPQNQQAAAPEGPTVGSGRGATAFQWSRSLVYDQGVREAVMNGDVQVIHRPDANGGQPFNLSGQTLTAYLEPDPAATKPAKTAAAAGGGGGQPGQPVQPVQPVKTASTKSTSLLGGDDAAQQKFRLKRITVRDNVHVVSNSMNFDAHDLSYDPLAQLLTASGDDANPVVVFNNKDGSTTTASELEWNTKTDQFSIKRLGGKVRR